MSLAEMTIVPVGATPPTSKPTGSGSGMLRPSGPTGTIVHRDGKFTSSDGGDAAPIIRREGGATGVAPPKDAGEILKRFGATWAQNPVAPPPAADAAKPAEGDKPPQTAAPAAGAAADKQPEAGKEPPKEPAKPESAPPPADDFQAAFGERKPSEVKADLDRYIAANRQLAADLETARKQPTPASTKYAGTYIDNSRTFLRQAIAEELGIEDPQSPEVTAELAALTLDLNAEVFGAQLDDAQQAKRDAAKARQALARDTRARKAQGDSSPSTEEAATKRHLEFIGNRLSATSTGSDGKALPSMREQFPLAAAMARRSGIPLEAHVLHEYLRTRDTGRYDPKRGGDDDYLIHETLKALESQAQDLHDDLVKARPQPSTAPQPTQPAPAPAAATSASQGQPQSHGGRTALTAADSSAAPPTPPSAPVPQAKRKLQTREEFFAKHYPKQ